MDTLDLVYEMLNTDELGEIKDMVETLNAELLKNHRIEKDLYTKYDVKRGLRDSNGKGVLTGLTEVSDVSAYEIINDERVAADGSLYYQGYNVSTLIDGLENRRFGFEEIVYLLLFGKLPNEKELTDYLIKILDKEVFDHSGLIYGMGHAVYTLSDPREVILKEYARKLSEEKGKLDEFLFYERVEKLSAKLIMEKHTVHKNVCANVDFYSGMVYTMLGIPEELFTPIFAIARIPGWCAHRLEELLNGNKIIRPAYMYVGHHVDEYNKLEDRA